VAAPVYNSQRFRRVKGGVKGGPVQVPTNRELYVVALHQAIPFVVFGILKNSILILAGEAIDIELGHIEASGDANHMWQEVERMCEDKEREVTSFFHIHNGCACLKERYEQLRIEMTLSVLQSTLVLEIAEERCTHGAGPILSRISLRVDNFMSLF
jgi:hypothetical protein